jgi:hypothetical protein
MRACKRAKRSEGTEEVAGWEGEGIDWFMR